MPLTLTLILLGLGGAAPAESPYPWLASLDEAPATRSLEASFAPPPGFTRVELSAGSYGAWLRGLPVRTDRKTVLSHRGRTIAGAPSAGVVLMDVGRGNLQQCADSALRLHAEYLFHKGQADDAVYHFTNGKPSAFAKWRRGQRFKIKNKKLVPVSGGSRARATDHKAYRAWLQHLFIYAGTASLHRDSRQVAADAALMPGDFFVAPGSPGHAVVILDVATDETGRRAALIGQGFMPAQEFHVLSGHGPDALQGAWYLLPGPGGRIDTPSWEPFAREDARRFTVGD